MPTLGQIIRSAVSGSVPENEQMHDASPIDPWTAEAMKLMQFQQQQVAMLRRRKYMQQQQQREQMRFQRWLQEEADQQRRKGAIREATRIANSLSPEELRKRSLSDLLKEFPPGLAQEYAVPALRDVFQTAQQQQSLATTIRQQEAQAQAQEYISNILKKAGESDEADLSDILTSAFRTSMTDPAVGELPVYAQAQIRDYFADQMQSLEFLNEFEKQQLLEKIKSSPETAAAQAAAQVQASGTGLEKTKDAKATPEQFAQSRQAALGTLNSKLLELRASDPEKIPNDALRNMRALYEEEKLLDVYTPEIVRNVWPLMQKAAERKAGMRGVPTFQDLQLQDIYETGTSDEFDLDARNMAAGFFKSDGSFDTDLWEKHLAQFLGNIRAGSFDEAGTKLPPVERQLLMRSLTYNKMPTLKKAEKYAQALSEVTGKHMMFPEDYLDVEEQSGSRLFYSPYGVERVEGDPTVQLQPWQKYIEYFRPYSSTKPEPTRWTGKTKAKAMQAFTEDIDPKEQAAILRQMYKDAVKNIRAKRKSRIEGD